MIDKRENLLIKSISSYSRALRFGRKEDLTINYQIKQVDEFPLKDFSNIQTKIDNKSNTRLYSYLNYNENIQGSLFQVCLDTTVDNALKINGRVYINLIYLPVEKVDFKTWDGEYGIQFIKNISL